MAVLNGKAGQYAKNTSMRYFTRLLTVSCASIAVVGICLGSYLSRQITPITTVVFIAAVSAYWLIHTRCIEPLLDVWASERIKFLRGGQAEGLVAWLLKDLPNDWYVFNNVQIEDSWDLDHIVVGPGGLWCISTKSHRGLLSISGDGALLYNLRPVDWLSVHNGHIMRLKDRLKLLLGDNVPYIFSMLAAPMMFIDVPMPHAGVSIVYQDTLLKTLEEHKMKLGSAQIKRISEALKTLDKGSTKALSPRTNS